MLFMVRGIKSGWEQTLVNGLTNSSFKVIALEEILNYLTKLQDIDITVKVFVCDQASVNRKLHSLLNVTEYKPYFVHGNDDILFIIYLNQ